MSTDPAATQPTPSPTPVEASHVEAARRRVTAAKTVVVKVGSNVLVGSGSSVIDRPTFCHLVESIANVTAAASRKVVLVTSGAVAVGRRRVFGESGPQRADESLARKQALAAIGQPELMHLYAEEFGFYGRRVAQILLTRDDVSDRQRFLSARSTLRDLASLPSVVPIVNENDTVANDEIRFGDNDSLASLVVSVVGADALIILSDVAAVYTADPTRSADARALDAVYGDDAALQAIAGPTGTTSYGSGGMLSKVRAARAACSFGVPTVIAPGRAPGVLGRILSGEPVGTLVVPRDARLSSRKAWIGFGAQPEGVVLIDEGAAAALRRGGRSLLPGGVTGVVGDFARGASVELRSDGVTVARGLVAYDAEDLQRIAGRASADIVAVLGYHHGDAIVHVDDLVLLDA
ncbi:MAG: glutamate 5-kinase [Myxococcales bacterium]|nr:glutamate 5-kinase [Myxococcales bacterium]MCB9521668.1 glutamate 5-kinase [Myxococcales bacterium]MCB9534556.1 glutamate 5-kinase [Myxococcales bacterium]